MVTLPAGLVPQLQTDWSPAGQIYWYTIESKNPEYRRDGAKVARRLDARRSSSRMFPESSTSPASAA